MPITPDPPFPKTQGDNIRSKDWNDVVNELMRLDDAKADRAGDTFTGPLTINGAVGIGGITSPTEDLHVATRMRAQHMLIGAWPANANYGMVGTANLNQSDGANYALLQSGNGSDLGETYVNSRTVLHLRIGNADRMIIDASGALSVGPIKAGNSDLYFTKTDHNHTGFGNTAGFAAIENAASHGALMILGRSVPPTGRIVKLWDRLEVNGDLLVTGRIGTLNYPTTPRTNGWGGGLRTLDVEAEGTIWSRSGYQSGNRDLAEVYFSDLDLEPGDVVSLDAQADRIVPAAGPDDTAVIGIVSSEPAVVLNSQINVPARTDGKRGFPIALCGCVPCKVSAENGPIRRGDLLTSASKPGFAMRARSVQIDGRSVFAGGTLIGKAMSAHAEGEGEIEVFVILR